MPPKRDFSEEFDSTHHDRKETKQPKTPEKEKLKGAAWSSQDEFRMMLALYTLVKPASLKRDHVKIVAEFLGRTPRAVLDRHAAFKPQFAEFEKFFEKSKEKEG